MNPLSARRWRVALLFLLLAGSTLAATPSVVDEFPPVDRVLKEIQGHDPRDTQARQVGALRQLWHMVATLAQGRAETPDESRLRQSYNLAMGKSDRAMLATFDSAESAKPGFRTPRARWVALCAMYEGDLDLRGELLRRFFSPGFVKQYGARIRDGNFVVKHSAPELRQEDGGAAREALENLPWYKGPATLLALVSGLIFLWFLRTLRNELRASGLDRSNPRVLRVGRRVYDLTPVTGVLVDERKITLEEARTTITKDDTVLGGERTSTVVTKTASHRFNVATPDGKKTLVWVFHHRARVGEGHRVSAVNVTQRKKKYGDYFYFVDHTTSVRSHDGPRCRKIFRPRYTLLLSGTLALICAGLYARAFEGFPLNRANFPTVFDYSGSVAHQWLEIVATWFGGYGLAWVGAALGYAFLANLVGAGRARVFLTKGANQLVGELAAEAERQAKIGFDASQTPRERLP